MLHCPRCSGPLQVTPPDPDLKTCPAGDCCPHQRLSPPPTINQANPADGSCSHQPPVDCCQPSSKQPVDSCSHHSSVSCCQPPAKQPISCCDHQRLSPANSCQHKRYSLPPGSSLSSCQQVSTPAVSPVDSVDRFLRHQLLSPPLTADQLDFRQQHHRHSLPPPPSATALPDRCHQPVNCLSGGGILSDDGSQLIAQPSQQHQSNLFSEQQPASSLLHCCSHPPHQVSTPSMLTSHHFLIHQPGNMPNMVSIGSMGGMAGSSISAAPGFNLHLLPSGQLSQLTPVSAPMFLTTTIHQPFSFQPSIFTPATIQHQPLQWPPQPSRPTASFSVPQPAPQPFPVSSISEILHKNMDKLKQSLWYYPDPNSADLLQDTAPGTFLVRDSADPHFLFSLSVQRKTDGPTSIRIHFQQGRFRLDAEESIRHLMPDFPSVVELIDHYSSPKEDEDERRPVWVDNIGKLSSPICLRRPLYSAVPSLAHLARLGVGRRMHETPGGRGRTAELSLPTALVKYLDEYLHRV